MGPFYCPADETIYQDTTFFDEVLERQLGGPSGAFVEPYVLAHEYGHHIQNVLGFMGKVKTQQGPKSDAVRLELQADCFAGMWARAASTTDDKTGESPLRGAERLRHQGGDRGGDRGRRRPDPAAERRPGQPRGWTHGSAAQRVKWFQTGMQGASIDACDTFAADNL